METYLHQILAAITEMKGDLHSFITVVNNDVKPFLTEQVDSNNANTTLLEAVTTKIDTFNTKVNSLVNYNLVNEHYERNAQDLAYKKRHSLKDVWFKKRNYRKQLFFNILRDESTVKIYQEWFTTKTFLPKKYQPKKINGEPAEQTEIRKNLGFAKMKADIQLMTNRAEKNTRKLKELDTEMEVYMGNKAEGSILEKLKEIWRSEILKGEQNAIKEWQKKEGWLQSLPNHPPPQQQRRPQRQQHHQPAPSYADAVRNRWPHFRPNQQQQQHAQGQRNNYNNQRPHQNRQYPHNNANAMFSRGRPTMRQNCQRQPRDSVFNRLGPVNPNTYAYSGPSTQISFQQRRNLHNGGIAQQRHRITNQQGGFLGLGGNMHHRFT